MPVAKRYQQEYKRVLRDTRSIWRRIHDEIKQSSTATIILGVAAVAILIPPISRFADFAFIAAALYAWWHSKVKFNLPLKIPSFAGIPDPNNPPPGGSGAGKSEGILFLGNDKSTSEELWITNSDARTHILYLGTTGAGKTEGLKSLVANALSWGSGFVYIDGKADTNLWGSLFSLARRFGRDDDLLVLNYMTGNSDLGAPSNTMNPFVSGSASYLANMLVNLMDDAGDDNAMWKGRAISLLSSLMPALTYKRDNQGLLLDIGSVRDNLTLQAVIRLSRDTSLPEKVTRGLQSYLDTLPGFIGEAFDDEGNEVPLPPDRPPIDLSIPRQQHGYLSMQFTRALQSLADEYGYIFKSQLADINLMDVVLNRRMLVVLIPALEKSADEAANLGKIVAAALKGMMGSTLGAQIEGDWGGIIESKMTTAPSPFMTVFDEVGYYTAQGMAVMAAQARSLGFSLVFAAQDLPAMEKRVREEARSITGNCNLKIFGKLEDPTATREFFEKNMSKSLVAEIQGYSTEAGMLSQRFLDQQNASLQWRDKADYSDLRNQKEGEAHVLFGTTVISAKMFYAVPDKVKAMRVQRFLGVVPPASATTPRDRAISEVSRRFADPDWTASSGAPPLPTSREIEALTFGYALAQGRKRPGTVCGAMAIAHLQLLPPAPEEQTAVEGSGGGDDFDPFAAPGESSDFDLKSFWESIPTELTSTPMGSPSTPPLPPPPASATAPSTSAFFAPPPTKENVAENGGANPSNGLPSLEKLADEFFAKHFSKSEGTSAPPNAGDKAGVNSMAASATSNGKEPIEPYVMPAAIDAMMKKTAQNFESKLFSSTDGNANA